MRQKLIRIFSAILVVAILCINSSTIAIYAAEAYKRSISIEDQGTSTNNENVEFDVYYAGKKHSKIMDVASVEEKLYLEIKVKNAGYLENAQIDLSDCNFNISDDESNYGKVHKVDAMKKIVTLNKIAAGNTVKILLNISSKKDELLDPNAFDKDSIIKMRGTYINENAKEVPIKKDIIINAKWHGQAEIELSQEVARYIPFKLDEEKGLLIQTKINVSVKDSLLPIDSTKIETTAPIILNEKPTKVMVYSTKTMATNGESTGEEFNQSNYNYDAQNGILTINVDNKENSNGFISWKKSSSDEYFITYVYSADIYDQIKDKDINITSNTTAICKLYNDEKTEVPTEVKLNTNCNSKIGEIININASIKEEDIAKGYIYSNKIASEEDKNETIYNLQYNADISYAELLDKLTIEEKSDKFIAEDGSQNSTAIAGNNYVYDKLVTISKKNMQKILGDEGYLNIIFNGNIIETINKDSKVNDEGNIVIDISDYNANTIKIETSKPIVEGMLIINVKKAVSKNVDYSKSQLEIFKQLNSSIEGSVLSKNITIEANDSMNLVEPTSKAILSINKEKLSTSIKNEDVEIKAILETDSADDILYKNPTLYINLPKCVSNVDIKSVKPLYEDELTVRSTEVVNMGDYKSIKVELEGSQTKYNDTTSKGLNILIYADINVNKTTPSIRDTITMIYTNENDAIESRDTSLAVDFVTPKEVIAVNGISGYSTNGADVTTANDETKTVQLDIYGDSKIATVHNQIINNYDNTISDVRILGRIPNKESANYDSTELMENTFDTILNGAINLTGLENGYTIYYSENNGANTDLNDTNNGWITTINDYSLVKSYLIVINNELAKSANIEWTYGLKIPADLGYKNSINNNYKIYLKNNLNSGAVEEEKMSPVIRLETEEGPGLNVKINSYDVQNRGSVTKGKKIRFYVQIKNTSDKDLNNVKLEIPLPKGMEYNDKTVDIELNKTTGCVEHNIGSVLAGENTEIGINFDVDEVTESEIIAKVSADEFNGYVKNDTYKINIINADIALINFRELGETPVSIGDISEFLLKIKNISGTTINNVSVEYQLPSGLEYEEQSIENQEENIQYDSKRNTVTIKIEKLVNEEEKYINIKAVVKTISDNMQTVARTTVNGKEYTSNVIILKSLKTEYNLTAINPGNKYVTTDEEIVSEFEIENTGEVTIYDTELIYKIPEGTEFISASINAGGEQYDITPNMIKEDILNYTITELSAGENAHITINLRVNLIIAKNEQKINSILETVNDRLGNKQSPTLTYIMKKIEEEDDNNKEINNNTVNNNEILDPGNNEEIGYKINGKVWIDCNKNGEFDNNEETVSEINIVLINKETNEIETTTITNDEGNYMIDGLKNGDYMVAFLYDSSEYTITEYQKSGVNSSRNSDAIKSTIKYNNIDTTVGLTDTIQIENKDVQNIDMGIYESDKFDLSLKKYVNKITINNSTGVVTYDYQGQNKSLAKVDIPAKQMDSSTVIIEYKLVVKNEGTVSGYAKKIVDYLPNDLKFSSELNKKAYIGKDGNIYSEELAQTKINPGESKEIILVLTKQMTGENTGTIVNKAEIAEDYNEFGLKDINSTPGNNDEKENDLSYANAIITVKTGQVVIYTTLTIAILAILIFGTYEIRKYVIKN